MKKLILFLFIITVVAQVRAQDKKVLPKNDLPEMKQSIHVAVADLPLYTQNFDHLKEHDVNSIINDIESHLRYIDSFPKTKKYSDVLLIKYFAPLRHFFLTTTNTTSLASSFLYTDAPYRFCMYNDTALMLHISALRDGDIYNLAKVTEQRSVKSALESCLLPSLKATDEFKTTDIKYIGLSVYYGCKDTREGAPPTGTVPYCLTYVMRLADLQQYDDGLITLKGLMATGEVYISNESGTDFTRIQMNTN